MARQSRKDTPAPSSDLEGLVTVETQSRVQAQRSTPVVSVCWVLPENWPVVQLFLLCRSCWQYAFSGHPIGMRYEAVDVVIKRAGFEPFIPDDFKRFTRLEHYFLGALTE